MAILKNINESGTDFNVLFERNSYVTDPLKTRGDLIGAWGCCHENFPKISRALKRSSHQKDSKMLRHSVVAISPEDEGKIQNTELLKAARKIAGFFKDCYVLYVIHTNTAHTHFHVLVCNTHISDGKQISMSESDLECFKEHCSAVLREYGLRPIEKLDKSDDLLEINENLFPKALSQDERINILYEGVNEPRYDRPSYYRPAPVQNCGNITNINVIIPHGTQGTLFQGRNGQPCISFKPSPYYGQLPLGNIPQSNAVCDGNTAAGYTQPELPSCSSDWFDQDPEWIKDGQSGSPEGDDYRFTREDIADNDYDSPDDYDDYDDDDCYNGNDDDGCQDIAVEIPPNDKPLGGGAVVEAEASSNKINPLKIFRVLPPQTGENGKPIPIVFLEEIRE